MHVPYHFAIVGSGEKLGRLSLGRPWIDFAQYFPWADVSLKSWMAMVLVLYRLWMQSTPEFNAERSVNSKQGSTTGSEIGGSDASSENFGNTRAVEMRVNDQVTTPNSCRLGGDVRA